MRLLLFIAISTACFAQRYEVAVSAIGNFNPTSYIYIQHPQPEVISSSRSSFGGGASYQRWINDHVAFGAAYEQNPSSGKLFDHTYYIRWPQMRYEVAGFSSQKVTSGDWSLFVREGAGSIITNGHKQSGWSHDFAVLEGFGADYRVRKNMAWRGGMTILESELGCYNDTHGCRATWSFTNDVNLGVVFRW